MAQNGAVRYTGYKSSIDTKPALRGSKNKRKSKISKIRREEAIDRRVQEKKDSIRQLKERNKYAIEAKEWMDREREQYHSWKEEKNQR